MPHWTATATLSCTTWLISKRPTTWSYAKDCAPKVRTSTCVTTTVAHHRNVNERTGESVSQAIVLRRDWSGSLRCFRQSWCILDSKRHHRQRSASFCRQVLHAASSVSDQVPVELRSGFDGEGRCRKVRGGSCKGGWERGGSRGHGRDAVEAAKVDYPERWQGGRTCLV